MSELAQFLISFSGSVVGELLVLLVLKSIGKISWTPTGMGLFLLGVTPAVGERGCAGMLLPPPLAHYSRQNTALENISLAGTHVLVDLKIGARALHGGSSCGQGYALLGTGTGHPYRT